MPTYDPGINERTRKKFIFFYGSGVVSSTDKTTVIVIQHTTIYCIVIKYCTVDR